LFFLNNTTKPAILIEVCFVDSEADAAQYRQYFEDICDKIAEVLGGEGIGSQPPPPGEEYNLSGKVSWFGGPDDLGVDPDEGLAFIYDIDQAPHLLLAEQPPNTTGLARRLNPYTHYIACRWDYDAHPKDTLLSKVALVRAVKTGVALTAIPADWGPHVDTGRIADLSPSLMKDLGIETDDTVEIIFPYYEEE
jgi:hypothetical protein